MEHWLIQYSENQSRFLNIRNVFFKPEPWGKRERKSKRYLCIDRIYINKECLFCFIVEYIVIHEDFKCELLCKFCMLRLLSVGGTVRSPVCLSVSRSAWGKNFKKKIDASIYLQNIFIQFLWDLCNELKDLRATSFSSKNTHTKLLLCSYVDISIVLRVT